MKFGFSKRVKFIIYTFTLLWSIPMVIMIFHPYGLIILPFSFIILSAWLFLPYSLYYYKISFDGETLILKRLFKEEVYTIREIRDVTQVSGILGYRVIIRTYDKKINLGLANYYRRSDLEALYKMLKKAKREQEED